MFVRSMNRHGAGGREEGSGHSLIIHYLCNPISYLNRPVCRRIIPDEANCTNTVGPYISSIPAESFIRHVSHNTISNTRMYTQCLHSTGLKTKQKTLFKHCRVRNSCRRPKKSKVLVSMRRTGSANAIFIPIGSIPFAKF